MGNFKIIKLFVNPEIESTNYCLETFEKMIPSIEYVRDTSPHLNDIWIQTKWTNP